jgi:hypothetical protein
MRNALATLGLFVAFASAAAPSGVREREEPARRRGAMPSRPEPDRHRGPHAGTLLWEDRADANGWEEATSVAARGDRVYAVGFTSGVDDGVLIRATDARTGALAWQDQVGGGWVANSPVAAADDDRVYVAWSRSPESGGSYEWVVRAYEGASGALLWEDVLPLGVSFALVTGGGRVYVAGSAPNPSSAFPWTVRAHEPSTGTLLWQDQMSGPSEARTLAFADGRLYAGGVDYGQRGANVRAYEATTGALLWEHLTPGPGGLSYTQVVKAHGRRVFGLQVIRTGDPAHAGRFPLPRVVARDGATGELLWEDVVDVGPMNRLSDLDVSGSRVTAVGSGGPRCRLDSLDDCDVLVRTWRAATGARLWERQLDLSGLNDRALLVAADEGSLFVHSLAGSPAGQAPQSTSPAIEPQWVVHAFAGATGELRWQAVGAHGDRAAAMALEGGRLFLAGMGPGGPFEKERLVRAYDARGRKGRVELPLRRQVSLVGTSGEASYDVTFDGPVTTAAHGLVPAREEAGAVADDPADDIWEAYFSGVGVTLHALSIPEGTRHVRIALFDEATDGPHDLDLYVVDSFDFFVPGGESVNPNSNEVVDLHAPEPGEYTVVVHGYGTNGPEAHYTLSTWMLGDAAEGNLAVCGPARPTGGRVELRWSGLTAPGRHLGAVSYRDSAGEIGQTLVSIRAED